MKLYITLFFLYYNYSFIYGWGSGMLGKLGSDLNDIQIPTRLGTEIKNFRNQSYYQVSAGVFNSMALNDNGNFIRILHIYI